MFIYPHAHMISRTTDDYDTMAHAGVVAVIEPFFLARPAAHQSRHLCRPYAGRSVMTTSRRDVLLQGAVIGAGVIAANMTGMEA